MLALGGKEFAPGHDLRMLLQQRATLAFGHATPHTELDAVVEGIGTALGDDRAVPADDRGLALGGPSDEQFIWIGLSASRLRHPGDAGLGLSTLDDN